MHRDAFDIAAVYGKDIFLAIRHLGTDRLAAHYRALDPCNCMNPGIGKTTKRPHWGD